MDHLSRVPKIPIILRKKKREEKRKEKSTMWATITSAGYLLGEKSIPLTMGP